MKVAVLTFHETTNYGAMLQTFSLQRFLLGNCIETVVLDYKNENLFMAHKVRSIRFGMTLKEFILFILLSSSYNQKFRKFEDFRNRFIIKTNHDFNKNTVGSCVDDYDVLDRKSTRLNSSH